MQTTENLQYKVDTLDHLLTDPHPDNGTWTEQLLTAFEQVTEYALHPGVPVRASSRAAQQQDCPGRTRCHTCKN